MFKQFSVKKTCSHSQDTQPLKSEFLFRQRYWGLIKLTVVLLLFLRDDGCDDKGCLFGPLANKWLRRSHDVQCCNLSTDCQNTRWLSVGRLQGCLWNAVPYAHKSIVDSQDGETYIFTGRLISMFNDLRKVMWDNLIFKKLVQSLVYACGYFGCSKAKKMSSKN